MQTRFVGTRELGLKTEWRFAFIPPGTLAEPTPCTLYLDVGGRMMPGVLDHHGGTTPVRCTAEAVMAHPEFVHTHLVGPFLSAVGTGRALELQTWRPTLVLHTNPDWDAVVAAFLAIRLVEDGAFPPSAPALVEYAIEVDQGRFRLDRKMLAELHAPHLGHLAIQHLHAWDSDRQLRRGMALLERVVGGYANTPRKGADFHASKRPEASSWTGDEGFQDVVQLLADEPAKFEQDLQNARCVEDLSLPATNGDGVVSVRGLILDKPPASALNKYWVRASGYPLFVCPLGPRGTTSPHGPAIPWYPRVIISLDPNFDRDGRAPSLRGLGFALEQAEARIRLEKGLETRSPVPRYPDGYCGNGDPWYDGRGHEWTIVDSPFAGTVLPYPDICAILEGGTFWNIPLTSGILTLIWVENQASDGKREGLPMPESISTVMKPFFEDVADHIASEKTIGSFLVRVRIRHHPWETCADFRIVDLIAREGATLEELIALREHQVGDTSPDYCAALLEIGVHFSGRDAEISNVRTLVGNTVERVVELSSDDQEVMASHRAVVSLRRAACKNRSDCEILGTALLYHAFLGETLSVFSSRIAALVPSQPGDSPVSRMAFKARSLRESFLRFQARYFQMDFSRIVEFQMVFEELGRTLGSHERYLEVQRELGHLRDLEDELAEDRRRKADKGLQGMLALVSIAEIIQMIQQLLQWGEVGWSISHIAWIAGLFAAAMIAVVIYLKVRA